MKSTYRVLPDAWNRWNRGSAALELQASSPYALESEAIMDNDCSKY